MRKEVPGEEPIAGFGCLHETSGPTPSTLPPRAMAEVLILTDEVPIPIQANGQSLRLNPVVRHLAARHTVDLAVLGDRREGASRFCDEARGFCREVVLVKRPDLGRFRRWGRTVRALADPRRPPWEEVDPFSDEFLGAVTGLMRGRQYDTVLALLRVNDVVSRLMRDEQITSRFVMDWIDAPSLHHERSVQRRGPVGRWIGQHRTRALVRWQQRLNARADAAIYIAATDRAHAGESDNPRVFVVANGVLEEEAPQPPAARPVHRPPTIGFLGNMAYRPNVQAARRLHDHIFVPLTRRIPDLHLKIIGREPVPEICALASPQVEVTGAVPSIWPALAEVDVMVFPMETGGGLQNKVLEAIAGGCAVVVTTVGASGTGPAGTDALEVADTDDEIVERVERLLGDAEQFEQVRRRAVRLLEHFRWETILPRYEAVLLGREFPGRD